jgi:hypothetical protein
MHHAFHDPAAREASSRAIEATFRPDRQLLRVRDHINDPAFAAMVVAEFQNRRASGFAQKARCAMTGRAESRSAILERFRAMMARGEPIIGGGAGTGLSAKCEEAGGIDLIVIYNSRRFRMAGRGSRA